MKYLKFIIRNYKGISNDIEIDLAKKSLIPIIGINECGKTTILNAICSFDWYNDDINDTIRQLTDVKNLYKISSDPAVVEAVIAITKQNFKTIISDYYEGLDPTQRDERRKSIPLDKTFNGKVVIQRIIESENECNYKLIAPRINLSEEEHNDLCKEIVRNMPYILYFDDFRDSFPEEIEVPSVKPDNASNHWLDYIEQLFVKTNKSYSIYDLHSAESRLRKSMLSDVSKKLNTTLTREWTNFRFDEKDPLSIAISFEKREIKETEKSPGNLTLTRKEEKWFIKFEVIEKDAEGNDRYFYVRDRSKGFYWFFNFVMKLEFNHKIIEEGYETVYLLDEPGSYLHPYAQTKLCKKLKDLSESNKVLFCTHSHYLLNPEIIPLNTIHISSKNGNGEIVLVPYYSYKNSDKTPENSFQTIYDALQLRPFLLDFSKENILMVEGIYDYYSLSLFSKDVNFNILPATGTISLNRLISVMIGFRINYKVLWDNDGDGTEARKKAVEDFGEDQGKNRFFTLETKSKPGKRILQDLFAGEDIVLIKEDLNLTKDTSFEKTISALYFSNQRESIIAKVSIKTKENFNEILEKVKF